jgi:hypothetical protein
MSVRSCTVVVPLRRRCRRYSLLRADSLPEDNVLQRTKKVSVRHIALTGLSTGEATTLCGVHRDCPPGDRRLNGTVHLTGLSTGEATTLCGVHRDCPPGDRRLNGTVQLSSRSGRKRIQQMPAISIATSPWRCWIRPPAWPAQAITQYFGAGAVVEAVAVDHKQAATCTAAARAMGPQQPY